MLPERRTLSQAVTEAVLERIRAGEFRAGDRLPTEKGLMQEYSVGRNAAREAIQALVAMGLVEVRPGRGATLIAIEGGGMDRQVVSALLKDQAIEDLYAFRRLLELETAARAAERASEEDVEDLHSCTARYRQARARGRSVSAIDNEFHATIARASHNMIYITVLDAVSELIGGARRLAEPVPWAMERAEREHEELVDAIEVHDPERAVEVMQRHLDGAIQAIREGRRVQSDPSAQADDAAADADVATA